MFDERRLAKALKKIKEKSEVYEKKSKADKEKGEVDEEKSEGHEEKSEVQSGLQLCLRATERLHEQMAVLSGLEEAQRELVADAFTKAVEEYLLALRLQNYYGFLLYWVATSQRLVAQVVHTHERVDEIYAVLGIEEDAELAQWRDKLAEDRAEQDSWLENKLNSTAVRTIINEVPSPEKLKVTLALLANQLSVWSVVSPDDGTESSTEELKLSRKQEEFMQTTLDSVSEYSGRPDAFDWFVTNGDVKYDKKDRKESLSGTMYEGSWVDVKTGKRHKVAIKFIDKSMTAEEDNRAFSQEISSWFELSKLESKNKHILKMLGANHRSEPMFFVSELATEGNFADFFHQKENQEENHKKNQVLLWKLFIQAAQGLQFLHEDKVEHGGLTCTNILLTRPEGSSDSQLVVKLSDFGMARVRTESVSISDAAKRKTTRYNAPERLVQTTAHVDFCRADTYSLGLCIIDAATGEPPFGVMGDDEVIAFKLDSEPIERPYEGFTDAEWDLVSSMCDNDPSKRPSLDEVIEKMKELDQVRDPKILCSSCHERVPTSYSFCGGCGAAVAPTPAGG